MILRDLVNFWIVYCLRFVQVCVKNVVFQLVKILKNFIDIVSYDYYDIDSV